MKENVIGWRSRHGPKERAARTIRPLSADARHTMHCLPMLALIPLLPARRAAPFILTDESAAYRLMATQAVKAKEKKIYSIPVICCVEGCARGEVDLYLGEDHEDLIFRIGAYRVTRDGRVWVNSDPTLLDDEWVVVK